MGMVTAITFFWSNMANPAIDMKQASSNGFVYLCRTAFDLKRYFATHFAFREGEAWC
jgi:hypothetical protein